MQAESMPIGTTLSVILDLRGKIISFPDKCSHFPGPEWGIASGCVEGIPTQFLP
jgi:hypothetical protein